jgi:hypothetical protein
MQASVRSTRFRKLNSGRQRRWAHPLWSVILSHHPVSSITLDVPAMNCPYGHLRAHAISAVSDRQLGLKR